MNTLTLHQRTTLTVQIAIQDDTGVLAFVFSQTMQLFTLFWQTYSFVQSTQREINAVFTDLQSALSVTGKLLMIGFKSVAYGLGVGL